MWASVSKTMHINRTHNSIQLVFSCSLITTVKEMAFISNLLVYLALFQYLQVVEAPAQNISVVAVTKSVEVKLVGMDQGLCDYIEPLVWPRIVVIFVFNTPTMACTPCQTTLAKFIGSSNKTLSYSHNNTKCSLRKKEGMIEETNSTTTAPPYVVIVLVNNTFPSERNKPNKKDLLYQKVRDYYTINVWFYCNILGTDKGLHHRVLYRCILQEKASKCIPCHTLQLEPCYTTQAHVLVTTTTIRLVF